MKQRHKYLVTFYKYNKVHRYVCTRTFKSVFIFALKKVPSKGIFTIKRLDK